MYSSFPYYIVITSSNHEKLKMIVNRHIDTKIFRFLYVQQLLQEPCANVEDEIETLKNLICENDHRFLNNPTIGNSVEFTDTDVFIQVLMHLIGVDKYDSECHLAVLQVHDKDTIAKDFFTAKQLYNKDNTKWDEIKEYNEAVIFYDILQQHVVIWLVIYFLFYLI